MVSLRSSLVILWLCAAVLGVLECSAQGSRKKQHDSATPPLNGQSIAAVARLDSNDYKLLADRVERCEQSIAQAEKTVLGWMLAVFVVIVALVTAVSVPWVRIEAKRMSDKAQTQVLGHIKKLEEMEAKNQHAMTAAKDCAFTLLQFCTVLADIERDNPKGTSAQRKFEYAKNRMLLHAELARARLAVKLGNSDEVISGANFLSQRGVGDLDEPIMALAANREGLSAEARETLMRAISDLRKRTQATSR
jgi:hypothetical protein